MGKKSVNNGHRFDAELYQGTADSWGENKKVSDEAFDYETSSGKRVLIRKIGIEDILDMGLIDKMDFFRKALSEADKPDGEKADEKKSMTAMALENWASLKTTVHQILLVGVIAPVLQPVPTPPDVKKDGLLYVDSVPFEDAIELFGEIFDSGGLATFREESPTGVGDVPAEQSVPSTSE